MSIYKKEFWRPNNYRRGAAIVYKRPFINTGYDLFINTGLKSSTGNIPQYPDIAYGDVKITKKKVAFIKNFCGVTIQFSRNKIIGIWDQEKIEGVKLIHLVEGTARQRADFINSRVKKTKDKIDNAIREFAGVVGVDINPDSFKWYRHEDFSRGDKFINSLPREVIIHNEVFKKVYPVGVEFVGGKGDEPGEGLINYIKSRAVDDREDLIIRAVEVNNPFNQLKFKCKCVEDVIDNKHLVDLLDDAQKDIFSVWTFTNLSETFKS